MAAGSSSSATSSRRRRCMITGPRVDVSTEHSDFFVRNLVAILAEARIGLAVKQPLALTYGDFGNVA
ncbi:hypothetical protein GOD44_03700 [Sinorhizobium medicae]|uniref:hypothetical protein n=1 Tax=Sinorhizobium medicae TaxID=110321 RepID=UPI000FD3D520|nr:hypothetical protein [Sinorhizobium medicae]MDX0773563.1 hypothetical protein [Sinorhizobium medicae]MDX0884009.1 hypothetical protein [Sinorhizobium medicae]MDX0889476.1 hypothetical protein [Sinorhizobium medicae]MDX0978464.1 hypothetical protein [Sinorhizobium medicae]MDX1166978.1 hypothetical protein [Sinorhizobium medicae]